MVLGVYRRVTRSSHAAEDAFQATFLVLARKAGALSQRDRLGSWLHGLAHRIALKARVAAARRRLRERQIEDPPHARSEPADAWDGLGAVIDEELSRLPEKYRLPVVLCGLECRPRRVVAGQLAIPEGILSSRLLSQSLSCRGLTLSGAASPGWAQ
jgi:DNA-directed RNA polymerase specialized sigma24 family protein